MPGYYIYLISSLPMLCFGTRTPFAFEKFLRICEPLVSEADINILRKSSIAGEYDREKQPTLAKWHAFDTMLRNELTKIRATRRHIDPAKYIRSDDYRGPEFTHVAMNAYRNPSILEAEKQLDLGRWKFLDELSFGHYFDIDVLIIYAHKLLILERWDKIKSADASLVLKDTLDSVKGDLNAG